MISALTGNPTVSTVYFFMLFSGHLLFHDDLKTTSNPAANPIPTQSGLSNPNDRVLKFEYQYFIAGSHKYNASSNTQVHRLPNILTLMNPSESILICLWWKNL